MKKIISILIIAILIASPLSAFAEESRSATKEEVTVIESAEKSAGQNVEQINRDSIDQVQNTVNPDIINLDNIEFTNFAGNLISGGMFNPNPEPAKEVTPPTVADPKSFLKSFQGKHEVSLFSGALNYYYPIWIPNGRNGMTPGLNLTYSSMDSRLTYNAGYRWGISTGSIYRTPKKGVDTMFTSNEFTADIFGNTEELILTNASKNIYAPKNEGSFNTYQFTGGYWIARDKSGNTYTFGQTALGKQADPADSTKVYKWVLEKVEDKNGNFMTFNYTQTGNAVYPDTIRYTGWGTNNGIYEIKFSLTNRESYTSYKTGFKVDHAKIIDKIDIISYASGSAKTVLTYDLNYTKVDNAVYLLSNIKVSAGGTTLPYTQFEYYSDSNSSKGANINALYRVLGPLGSTETFIYKPSTAYRESNGTSSNGLPFVVHTLVEYKVKAGSSDPEYSTKYDYRRGIYYYDNLDAYKKEYAGFGKVTVTDAKGNVRKIYFHQSEFDKNNASDTKLGEFSDHITKKGRIYRDEIYDNQNHLRKLILNKWEKITKPDSDPDDERWFVYLIRTTDLDYGEDGTFYAKAVWYKYDGYGNVTELTDYGKVKGINSRGDFQDDEKDKTVTSTKYIINQYENILGLPYQIEKKDYNGNLLGKNNKYYDDRGLSKVTKGNLTKEENYYSSSGFVTTQKTYNIYGLVTQITNPRNYKTTVTYDTHNLYPATITNAKGHITKYEYNYDFGVVAKITDPNNAVAETIPDNFGRMKESKVKDNSGIMQTVKKYEYDLTGTPPSITEKIYNGKGIEIENKTFLDGLNRPIQIKTEKEGTSYNVSSITYDELGNVKKEFIPKNSTTLNFETINASDYGNEYTYDTLGRVKTIINTNGTTKYNYYKWWHKVFDANDKVKSFYYDAGGNLITVDERVSSNNYQTHYEYDGNNNLTKITDAEGNVKEMTYDFFGRILKQELLHKPAESNIRSYKFTYDENSNLKSGTDAKGQVINYIYDELDRVKTENTNEVIYIYDTATNGKGRIASVTFSGNSRSYNYDITGNVIDDTKVIDSKTYKTSYEYDLIGNVLKITHPDNAFVNYTYNNAGQIESVPNYITNFDYSNIGTVWKMDFANGIKTENTYDPAKMYRLKNIKTSLGITNLQDISYTYDPVGNIIVVQDSSKNNAAKTANYTYDNLNRLTKAQITNAANGKNYTRFYHYTITGNITNKTDTGNYDYLGWHPQAVTKTTSQTGTKNYTYDDNGSLTSDGAWTHTYDKRGRLIKSEKGTSNVISYSYDEGGDRIMKNEDGEKTYYVNKMYEEEDSGSGKEVRKFVYANDVKVASLTVPAGAPSAKVAYYHADHLGSSDVVTDDTGKVIGVNDYYPYGDIRVEEKDTGYSNDYLYTGKELDRSTGLYYYGARYYDPLIGRFTGVDPVLTIGGAKSGKDIADTLQNPQMMNGYSYVANNPLKYTDPDGEFLFTPMIIDPSGNIPGVTMGQKYDPNPLSTVEKIATVALGALMTGGTITAYPLMSSAIATSVNATSSVGELIAGGKAGKEVGNKINKSKENVVIGKYPDYLKKASKIKAKTFNIPEKIWNTMKDAEKWTANQKFLDRAISRGDNFILSNKVKNIKSISGSFRKELDHLIKKGFDLSKDGSKMIKK